MDFEKRLNILKGQLEGIKKMINEKKDCIEVMQQFKAVKSGITQVTKKYMNHYFEECMQQGLPSSKKMDQVLNILLSY